MGGLGLRSQAALAPVAYMAGLEQTIPFFAGEKGICPELADIVGVEEDGVGRRWEPLLASGCRTGQELR